LDLAENQLNQRAARENVEMDRYRAQLRDRYKKIAADLKAAKMAAEAVEVSQ